MSRVAETGHPAQDALCYCRWGVLSAELPCLYTVASLPRVGEGEGRAAFGPICRGCKQAEPPGENAIVVPVRHESAALFACGRSWVVTSELRLAIEEAGLSGCSFRALEGGVSQLIITGRAQAASSWWRRMRDCPMCQRPVWRMTTHTTKALFAAVHGELAPPRSVYRERWQGDDLFQVDDPGPPIVTDRARDVLERFPIPGLCLQPAKFVRDRRLWA